MLVVADGELKEQYVCEEGFVRLRKIELNIESVIEFLKGNFTSEVCVLGYPILKYINFVLNYLNKPN